jgi:nitroreductase
MTAPDSPQPRLGLSADEVLTTTRAVRKRLDLQRPVPRAVIEECVEIARQAPSGRNRQQWDLVLVEDPATRRAVSEVWRRGLRAEFANGSTSRMPFDSDQWADIATSLRHLEAHLHDVPILVIPCLRVGNRAELNSIRGQAGNWGSVIPAFWSFMLAARERGIGTAWTTCHLSYEREMAAVLDLPFDTVVQAALTPLAYTIGTNFRAAPRADTGDFMHWNKW